MSYDTTNNISGTPFVSVLFPDNVERNDEYNVESRYNIDLLDNLSLTAGAFFLKSNISVIERRLTTSLDASGAPVPDVYTSGQFDQTSKSYAAFANLDWRITEALKISAGGRFSTERKDIVYSPLARCTGQSFNNCSTLSLSAGRRWSDFSPRFVLAWEPAERVLLFASYTSGFRSGNYNPRTTDATGVGIGPADPERVDSYEIGAKMDLLDRKVRLNLSAYQSNYNNIQQILTSPGNGLIQTLLNAADARIRGFEAEMTVRPSRNFEINANVGYTDPKYRKFDVTVPGVTDPTSLKFAKVSKWNTGISANYHIELRSLEGALDLRASYDWRSSFPTDFNNTPSFFQGSYGLTNGNIKFSRDNWSIAFFARNIFNVYYAETKTRNSAYAEFGGAPRTYGINLSFHM